MNTKVTLGVVMGLLALMMVVIASRRKSAEVAKRLQSSEQTVAELEQQLGALRQTVGRQSRLINQLRAEPLGQAALDDPGAVLLESDDLWVALEPFVEQHLEDREARQREEKRQRREEAMAKSRERRNRQLADQLGLNPFQSEQLVKVRDEFQAKRRDAVMPEEGEPLDPGRMKEILQQLNEDEQERLARFLTPEQMEQYQNRSSRAVQVMSFAGQADGALIEGLNLSLQMAPDAIGTSSIRMTLGDETGEAVVIEDRDLIVGDGEAGEFIFEEGEPPLPPLPPFPPPPPE